MTDRVLLARLCEGPASGASLARELGITRSAVWKRIESLRQAGVEVEAQPGRGYVLARPVQLLDATRLTAALSPEEIEEKFNLDYHFKHVDTIFKRVFG